jgi:ABC-type multidrug transport system fused ATPase/permease subunit
LITLQHDTLKNLLVRLWHYLSQRRRRQFGLLLGLMLVSAFAEIVSLSAVIPFLGILTAPDLVFNQPIVADVALAWGITSADQLVLPITVTFAVAALMAGVIRIILLWATTQLAVVSGADLSIEVYRRTLYQPYWVHASRNSSETISGITGKVDITVFGVLLPLLQLVSSIVLLVGIIIALIFINPMVALITTTGFGIVYGLLTWLTRRRLKRNSQRISYEYTQVIKPLQEGLGGIRDVLLDGTQQVYCDLYRKSILRMRQANGNNIFIGGSPRFAMESLGIVLITVLAFSLSRQSGGVSSALPVLGALALGAQRLLPALQQIYGAWTSIVGSQASLAGTIELLDQPIPPAEVLQITVVPKSFCDDIRFKGVRFRYTSDSPWVINGINLVIPKGARIGFVGSTGSGKSTMTDLLMGLLTPTEGEFLVDGQLISGNLVAAWQRNIAHVPQNIFLADITLAENIAFGVPHSSIDMILVQKVSQQAQIADFIESRPEGYNAFVGERGVRLSSGQCQRIGIARALYKQAAVLVLDEATSALDNVTEQSVMEAIERLNRNLTILLIAHRLTTVRSCDIIVEMENGRIVAQGTYEQLLECSPSFRKAALSMKVE